MKLRDKEKNILIDTFLKTAEYVLSIVVLGLIISGKFNLLAFVFALAGFISLIIIALIISTKTKEKK